MNTDNMLIGATADNGGPQLYEGLSEKDLQDFLLEIEDSDADLEAIEEDDAEEDSAVNFSFVKKKSAPKILADDDSLNLSEEEKENRKLEAQYGDLDPLVMAVVSGDTSIVCGKELNDKRQAIQKELALVCRATKKSNAQIQRDAFSQALIPLDEPFTKEQIKILIELLSVQHTNLITRYSNYINNRFTIVLKRLMPVRVIICYKRYPHVMKKSPGFMYSPATNKDHIFWVTPNIPAFFEQDSEQDLIMDNRPEDLEYIDRAVEAYYRHHKERADQELRIAMQLYKKKVRTYFDLLKLNPMWFEIMYNYKKLSLIETL